MATYQHSRPMRVRERLSGLIPAALQLAFPPLYGLLLRARPTPRPPESEGADRPSRKQGGVGDQRDPRPPSPSPSTLVVGIPEADHALSQPTPRKIFLTRLARFLNLPFHFHDNDASATTTTTTT